MTCPQAKDLIGAYQDGELDPAAAAEVSEHLRRCPECAAIRQNLALLSRALRETPELRFQPPSSAQSSLRRLLKDQDPPEPRRTWIPWITAAAALIVAAGVAWMMLPGPGDRQLAREIVSDHIRSLQASHLTDVLSTDNHTVKPWFNGKLDFSPPVEDLAARGFELVGGRLDYLGGRPVAALVYRRRLHVVNVFTWPGSAGENRPASVLSLQGYNVMRWSHAGMDYWAVSDLGSPELLELANLLRE
jgi:anti-sigma factor RsiW